MVKILDSLVVCRYKLILSKDVTGRYSIVYKRLSTKKATSRSDNMKIIFEVINDGELLKDVIEKTRNLLTMESMSSLFYEKFLIPEAKKKTLQNIMEKSIYMVTFFLWKKTTCLFRSIIRGKRSPGRTIRRQITRTNRK